MINLHTERVSQKYTLRSLAKEIGVSHQSVYCWEHGLTTPKLYSALKLTEVLDVPIQVLLAPEDKNSQLSESREPLLPIESAKRQKGGTSPRDE